MSSSSSPPYRTRSVAQGTRRQQQQQQQQDGTAAGHASSSSSSSATSNVRSNDNDRLAAGTNATYAASTTNSTAVRMQAPTTMATIAGVGADANIAAAAAAVAPSSSQPASLSSLSLSSSYITPRLNQYQHPYPPSASAAPSVATAGSTASSSYSYRRTLANGFTTPSSALAGTPISARSFNHMASSSLASASIAPQVTTPSLSPSTYMMGHRLVQAKISPKSSPTTTNGSVEDANNAAAAAATAVAAASRSRHTVSMTTTRLNTAATAGSASAAAAYNSSVNNDGHHQQYPPPPNPTPPAAPPAVLIDDVDVTRLRMMVESSLGVYVGRSSSGNTGSGVPCPSSTILFFAGILYGKTQDVHDNWLYAMTLYQTCGNGGSLGGGGGGSSSSSTGSNATTSHFKRLLAWLEKPDDGLLTTRGGRGAAAAARIRNGAATVNNDDALSSRRYYWDAVLWAATAYSELGDYNAVTQVWTEHCVGNYTTGSMSASASPADHSNGRRVSTPSSALLTPYLSDARFWSELEQCRASSTFCSSSKASSLSSHHSMLEDDDIDGWTFLGHCLRRDLGLLVSVSPSKNDAVTTFSIHPLSRVLCLRANAYRQLGHPQRASLVYLAAFRIDPYLIEAFDGWLDNGGCGTATASSTTTNVTDAREGTASSSTPTSSNSIPTAEQLSTTLQQVLDGDNAPSSPLGFRQIVVDEWLKTYYWAKLFASGAGVGGNAGLSSSSFMRPSTVPQGQAQEAIAAASSVPAPSAATSTSAASPNIQDAQEVGGLLSTPIPPNIAQLIHRIHRKMRPMPQSGSGNRAGGGAFDAQAAAMDAHLEQQHDDTILAEDGGDSAMETPTVAMNMTSGFFQEASFHHANLTPIPQQTSMSMMNASVVAGGGTNNNTVTDTGATESTMHRTDRISFAVLTENTALDTLWNKYKLQKSPEVLAMAAQQSYRRNDLRSTLKYCQALAEMDPLSLSTAAAASSPSASYASAFSSSSNAIYKAGFIHVCTLVALNHKRALFRLAHEWVDASPRSSRAWFAVGAYYYACKQYHVAQRHFCRATRLDPHCPEAWIAFGASFSACDESDQALASFRAAQRLAPGHHVSLLYMGMEYLRTNHIVLAQHFLTAAYRASNATDPLCFSELGVMCCQKSNFKFASSWFLGALALGNQVTVSGTDRAALLSGDGKTKLSLQDLAQLLEQVRDDYWEPTLFNLAQAFRKDHQYDMAILCLERALALKESAAGYAALGFCLHLKSISMAAEARSLSRTNRGAFRPGNTPFIRNQVLHRAIDVYHQSLARKPEDPFCSEMLQKALTDALEQTDFFLQGEIDEVDTHDNHSNGDDDMATPPVAPRPRDEHGNVQGGRRSMDSTSSSFMSMIASESRVRTRPPRFSTGEQSAATAASMASSQWTGDGLSLSVDESADDGDVDMS